MTEESHIQKAKKLTPLATAILGIVTGVICLVLPSIAAALGSPVAETTRQMLELGGAATLVGGAVGARFMPTKADK